MNYSKLAGWILLALGLIIILYALFASYYVFTGQREVPIIFAMEENHSSEAESSSSITEQMQKVMGEQLKGVIPEGSVSKLLNLISWSVLAGILLMGGGKISGLGIQLVKKT